MEHLPFSFSFSSDIDILCVIIMHGFFYKYQWDTLLTNLKLSVGDWNVNLFYSLSLASGLPLWLGSAKKHLGYYYSNLANLRGIYTALGMAKTRVRAGYLDLECLGIHLGKTRMLQSEYLAQQTPTL